MEAAERAAGANAEFRPVMIDNDIVTRPAADVSETSTATSLISVAAGFLELQRAPFGRVRAAWHSKSDMSLRPDRSVRDESMDG